MADKDTIGSMTDDMPEEEIVQTKKKSSILPVILKWVAVGLAVTVFVIAVTVVTVNIQSKKGKGFTQYPTSPEYRDETEVLTYYGGIDTIQTNFSGQPAGTVRIKVHLGHSQDDKNTPSEISARSVEIQDFLLSFLKNKSFDELNRNEEAIKIEIRNLINDNILTKGKIKRVMVTQYDLMLQE
ncbi:MAG: flagellar basal body-associated FliL family protein [Treponemataceae bacterium]